MIRLAISVEGPTEEEFVKRVLTPHLWERGVDPTPIGLNGNVTVERLAADMARLFRNFDRVTSLVDFYGFRDKGSATPNELEQKILEVIDSKVRRFNQSHAIPYVQQYEFEGLLFSNVCAFANLVNVPQQTIAELRRIRLEFCTPEHINDDFNTAPSKRIAKAIPRYQKVVDGPLIAEATGLDAIREECLRFDQWVTRLESLDN